jgi:hypothetical protein
VRDGTSGPSKTNDLRNSGRWPSGAEFSSPHSLQVPRKPSGADPNTRGNPKPQVPVGCIRNHPNQGRVLLLQSHRKEQRPMGVVPLRERSPADAAVLKIISEVEEDNGQE